VAPYSVEFADDGKEWDTGKGLRVMAVAYAPDYTRAAFACMVGPNGDCTHYLRLPHLMKRKCSFREEEKLQKVFFTYVCIMNGIRKLWEKFVVLTTLHHQSRCSVGSHCPQQHVVDDTAMAYQCLSVSGQGTHNNAFSSIPKPLSSPA
jgi:hypothetical protein